MYTPHTAVMDAEDVSLLNPFFFTGSNVSSPTAMDRWQDNTSYVPKSSETGDTQTGSGMGNGTAFASTSKGPTSSKPPTPLPTSILSLSTPTTPASSRSRLYDNQQGLKNLLLLEDDDELDLKTKYYIKPINPNQQRTGSGVQTPSRLFTHSASTGSLEDKGDGSGIGFSMTNHPREQGSPSFANSPPLKPKVGKTFPTQQQLKNRMSGAPSPNPSLHSSQASPSQHQQLRLATKGIGYTSTGVGKIIEEDDEDDAIRELSINHNDLFVCQACGMQQYHHEHAHHKHDHQELDSNHNSESHSSPPSFNVIELLIQQWSKISQRVSAVAINETGSRGPGSRPASRSGMSFFMRLTILPFLLSAFVPFTFCVVFFLVVLSALSLSTLAAFVFLLLTIPFFIVGIVGFLYVATFIINGSIAGGHRTIIVLGVSLFELLIKSLYSIILYLINMYKGINNGRSLRHR